MAGGLRYDGPENMPPGMRRLMEAQQGKQVAGCQRPVADTASEVDTRIPHPPLRGTFSPGEGITAAPTSSIETGTDPSTPLRCAQGDKSAKKVNKFRNVETVVDGIRFQSRKEARRFVYLKRAQELGVIEDLRLQVDFTLQEGFKKIDGQRVQAIRYVADFTYKVRSAGYDHALQLDMADIEYWRGLYPGALVIEDTKSRGTRTALYKLKRKLMADKGYEIREV